MNYNNLFFLIFAFLLLFSCSREEVAQPSDSPSIEERTKNRTAIYYFNEANTDQSFLRVSYVPPAEADSSRVRLLATGFVFPGCSYTPFYTIYECRYEDYYVTTSGTTDLYAGSNNVSGILRDACQQAHCSFASMCGVEMIAFFEYWEDGYIHSDGNASLRGGTFYCGVDYCGYCD